MNTRHHYLSLLRTLALAILTAAAVAACSDDIDNGSEPLTPPDGNGGIPVTFSANINPGSDAAPAAAPGTRTVLTPAGGGFTVKWKGTDNYQNGENDQIHIWASNGSDNLDSKMYTPTTSDVSSELKPVSDQNKLTLPSTGTWKFRAIYGSNWFTLDTGEPMVNLYNLRQFKPDDTDHIAYRDFSVATAEEDIAAENDEMPLDISLKFGHKLSALQLRVTNATDAELTIEEIRLAVVGEQMADYRVFDVTAGDWKAGSETRRDNLTLKIARPAALAPNATPQNFHMLLFPGYADKQMTITVVTNSGEYTLKKTAPASPGFEAGTNYMTDIAINSSNLDPNKETWTEYVNISTADELAAFCDQVNGGDNYQGKIVRLLNDITLTGTWAPIGTGGNPFSGTFDGGGHHIEGLNAACSNTDFVGLFGYIKDGTVRNLRVSGTVTVSGNLAGNYVGGIVGQLNNSTVENCIFSGGTVSGKKRVGGIAGYSWGNSRIAGCYTKGSVTATESQSGGIAGDNYDSSITNCYSEAVVEATSYMAGGIVGYNSSSSITNCYATGAVSTSGEGGGIVGQTSNGTITGCIALNPSLTRMWGNSTGFGRIAGWNYNNRTTINNCGAYKDMTITDNSGNTVTPNDVTVAGDALTREQCLTGTTYTNRGFKTDNNSWRFYSGTWTYLPWNKAFESFQISNMADYRITVPDHLNGGGTN